MFVASSIHLYSKKLLNCFLLTRKQERDEESSSRFIESNDVELMAKEFVI